MSLALLQELLAGGGPVFMVAGAMPPDELRYTLEFPKRPDVLFERDRISELLASSTFELEPFAAGELDAFLILRFPTIERTLPQRDLFALGYALCDALNLVSAEPDLGCSFYTGEEPGAPGRGAESAELIGPLCWVSSPAPADRHWALATSRVPPAWRQSRGQGIRIGQPDSGVARHKELDDGMLRLDLSWNVLTGSRDPTDPLRAGSANPGHGTGTASVAASREAGQIAGAAPEAELIPIRCLDDVKIFNAAPVTAAILHAVSIDCDVISMSLGGVPGRAMHRAIESAVGRGAIVVAAAGNCVRLIVWPARYAEVIAVAGTNILDLPWKGGSLGDDIDIAAPAELVWRAQRARSGDPIDGVAPGQGTSFATALIAGVAALWLAHHGRDAVRVEAGRRGGSVQDLFRAALKRTARVPAGWDDRYGPGVVDAEALIALPLADIPHAAVESASLDRGMARFLDEAIGPAAADTAFDWPRYQVEIAAIALAQAQLGSSPADLRSEAKWAPTRPSVALAQAVLASPDARLHRFGEADQADISQPLAAARREPNAKEGRLIPNSPSIDGPSDEAFLGRFDRRQLDRLEKLLGADGGRSIDRRLLSDAADALDRLARGGNLPPARIVLEALVRLADRPAIRVRNGRIQVQESRADWRDRLIAMTSAGTIEGHFSSIGRIDCDGAHVGTGFVIGPGLILTNRHVIQAFAAPVPRRTAPDRWVLTSDDITIDFADAPSSRTAATRFRLTAVVGSGPDDIDYAAIDLGRFDAAILAVESTNSAGMPLPPALPLDGDPTSVDRHRTLLVVGYPAQPASLPSYVDGSIDVEVIARLREIFGADYGTKYVAPGEVSMALGGITADAKHRVFCHDATTLAGNSGSAIIAATGPQDIVGLHFGGQWRRENYAHGLAAARASNPLLSDPGVTWTNL